MADDKLTPPSNVGEWNYYNDEVGWPSPSLAEALAYDQLKI